MNLAFGILSFKKYFNKTFRRRNNLNKILTLTCLFSWARRGKQIAQHRINQLAFHVKEKMFDTKSYAIYSMTGMKKRNKSYTPGMEF